MQTTRPIKEGRDQKNWDNQLPFFTRINVIHDPVNGNWTKHTDEWIEYYIGIIITKTENVENGKYFNKGITLEIIPVGLIRWEKFEYSVGVWIPKKVDHILRRILKQQSIFLDAAVMITPGIDHLGMVAIVHSNPAVKDPCHYFQQEYDNELWFA